MFNIFKWIFKRQPKQREVILGLALGSGGAKGYAELGALKAFEENGIKFDIIAGTSIGSIIGAFYADGYSATDILELLKKVDFSEIKSLIMINMDTAKVFDLIDRTIGSLNIEELKKPFVAIATELESGDEKVFDKGNCAMALCASSSYPPFFKPVTIDDKKYVDGAFANSIPADKVRQMGAEYVVGIDLSTHGQKPGFLTRMFATYQGKVKEPWKVGYDNSDIVIHPNLADYTPIQFKEGAKMFEIGYNSAMEVMPKILSDIANLKTNDKKKLQNKAKA